MNLRFPSCLRPALTIAAFVAISWPTLFAQGTFNCSNLRLQKALITDCAGSPVGGTNIALQIRVMNPTTRQFDPGILHVTADANKPLGHIPVLSGKNVGRFFVGTVLVPFVAPGTEATVEIRAWDASSSAKYEDAPLRGASVIKVQLGGVGQPPTMPGTMSQFSGLKLCPATSGGK